ncbi:MAG: hypothetical protein ABIJ50_06575 [Pseudomonadota bacterium]
MNIWKLISIQILLIWVSCPSQAGAELLGRLFFTPQERQALEQQRWAPAESLSAPDLPQVRVASPDTQPLSITLNGITLHGDGRQLVWLNGIAYSEGELPANVRLSRFAAKGQVEIDVPEKRKSYSLRPGQTLLLDSGQIREAYETVPADAPMESESLPGSDPKQPPTGESGIE